MRKEIAALGLPLAFEGPLAIKEAIPSLVFVYLDGRASLGRRWMSGVRDIALSPEVRGLAKRVLWTDPVGTWPRRVWERSPALQRRVQKALRIDAAVTYRESPPSEPAPLVFEIHPTEIVFDKATRMLGYEAIVPRTEAMALTTAWARWARLL